MVSREAKTGNYSGKYSSSVNDEVTHHSVLAPHHFIQKHHHCIIILAPKMMIKDVK